MDIENTDLIMQNKIFLWTAFVTGLILLIPFLLMQFHVSLPDPGSGAGELNWTLLDFIVMGTLIFSIGSIFVMAVRNVDRKHWLMMGIVFFAAFLYVWAELAVGIFTNLGS